jgi:predicted Zn-dependent protease
MKPCRHLLVLSTALLGAAIASAQFGGLDFNKLKKGLDTAKDAGKILKGVTGIGPEEERNMGEAVALELIGKYGGVVRDEAVSRRVNLVGRALGRYSDRPQLDWRFAVLDSDTVNAFSAPDGYVFITKALYDQAPTDDLLAAILAHEIAHITGKHALNIVSRNEAFGALTKQVTERSGNARSADAVLKQLNLSTDLILKTLLEKGFDPQTEFAADLTGHNLAATCGYAPGGLRAVLVHLQEQGGDRKKVFVTHPPLADRIKRLPNEPAPAPVEMIANADAKDQPVGEAK